MIQSAPPVANQCPVGHAAISQTGSRCDRQIMVLAPIDVTHNLTVPSNPQLYNNRLSQLKDKPYTGPSCPHMYLTQSPSSRFSSHGSDVLPAGCACGCFCRSYSCTHEEAVPTASHWTSSETAMLLIVCSACTVPPQIRVLRVSFFQRQCLTFMAGR
jgi:hypothetical protein